jgi:hypothetical protein
MPGQAVYIRYQAVCEFLRNNEDSHSSRQQYHFLRDLFAQQASHGRKTCFMSRKNIVLTMYKLTQGPVLQN